MFKKSHVKVFCVIKNYVFYLKKKQIGVKVNVIFLVKFMFCLYVLFLLLFQTITKFKSSNVYFITGPLKSNTFCTF